MSFNFVYSQSVSINDFVIGCSNVPILYERNKNYQPIISSIDIDISVASEIVPKVNDNIDILTGSVHLFTGKIKEVKYSYSKKQYECKVESSLVALQDKLLTFTGVQAFLTASYTDEEYRINDNDPTAGAQSNFKFLYVAQKLFEYCGLNLNTSSVVNIDVGKYRQGGSDYYVKGGHIAIDVAEFYCANQDWAMNPVTIEQNVTFSTSRYNLWDYFNLAFGYWGFVPVVTGYNTYKLMHFSDMSIPTFTKRYDYAYKINEPEYDISRFGNRLGSRDQYYLPIGITGSLNQPTPLPRATDPFAPGKSVKIYSIEWTNNMTFMVRNPSGSAGDIQIFNGVARRTLPFYNDISNNTDYYLFGIFPSEEYEYTTDLYINTASNWLSNRVDIYKENSEIKTFEVNY